jgi:hypothetical protein
VDCLSHFQALLKFDQAPLNRLGHPPFVDAFNKPVVFFFHLVHHLLKVGQDLLHR